MKKRIITCIAVGVSLTFLSGCSLLGRAIANELQNQAQNQNPQTSVQPLDSSDAGSGDWTIPGTDDLSTPDSNTGSDTGSDDWMIPGSDTAQDTTSDVTIGSVPGGASPSAVTSSYLSDEAEAVMKSLQTDYNKIAWGVRYNPGDAEGMVISVTPFIDAYGSFYLILGFTNIYDKPVTISASGYAKGKDGSSIGSIYSYVNTLGPGNTVVQKVYCSDTPTGEIHWDSFELKEAGKSYVYWEADYKGGRENGESKVSYTIEAKEDSSVSEVEIVLVDKDGYVIDYGTDVPEGKNTTKFEGEIKYFGMALTADSMDAAVFTNPVK